VTSEHVTSEDLPPELGALLASLAELPASNAASTVLGAALAARPAQPLQPPPTDDEVAAFSRAIDDMQRTLAMLTPADWATPSVNGLTVGELVGHLIGTQELMAAELGLATSTTSSTDHIESTRQAIIAGASSTPVEAATAFARASAVLTRHLSQLDEEAIDDIKVLLVVRVFELWTHDNDLRGAVGLDRVEPDSDRLWMMTRTVMPVVDGLGGDRLRVVLTGAGGGVWPASGGEIAEVVIDAVAFCRRVANRMPIEDLDAYITGDVAAADRTLNVLATLALD
jgi:uncharacterized protein (TIGR03083 family)